jgi:DNA primase
MARIPQDELERLKREIAVERLAAAYGIELKPHGHNLIGLCPMHADHEPSFVVTPAKNLWHCLGACQAGGSTIDLVMRMEGLSFRHAAERLRAELGEGNGGGNLPAVVSVDAGDRELLHQVVRYYYDTLKQSPEALAYLEKRGLRSAEMIERFQLGFANRTLTYRLPIRGRAKLRARLEKLGILRSSGHEHFNGALVIPIFDEHGQVSEMYGRKITPQLRKGTPLHLYLRASARDGSRESGDGSGGRGVWNWEALQASREIILCEALIDALTFWCAGFRNVTASYGVEGFTEDHLAAFKRYGTERVLIAYDRDDAGEKAAEKLAAKLSAAGIECFRVHFPKGMDANEYALKVTPAAKSFEVLLRHAQWIGKGNAPSVPLAIEPAIGEASADPTPTATKEEKPAAPESQPASSLAADSERCAAPPPPVSSSVEAPATEIAAEIKPEEIVIRFGDRRYRVRGLAKNTAYEVMRVNVHASRAEAYYVDTFDLYSAQRRGGFIKQAADELALKEDIIKKDLGKVLLKLEELQDEQIRRTLEPAEEKTVTLTQEEQAAALDLLKERNLLDRILADFERCGVVGEETNKLVGYLAAISRKLERPLAVTIQSSSAAGKTSLMEAILAFVPEEERVKYSAMTGQSLFYMGETDLRHKILAVVEEAGAERATYALKLLQSEGELSIASTGKDPTTGKLITHEYHVEGPVMILFTTTAVDLDEEMQNRCIVLGVDEGREQTRAIHRLQREEETLAGQRLRRQRAEILALHRNAQRLLKPILVTNPYAPRLTFTDTQIRTRRDHMKYLTLIRTIALLHQYQRPVLTDHSVNPPEPYIEVTRDDIAVANRLAAQVFGRSLDELSPQSRRFLLLLHQMVTEASKRLEMEQSDYRFSRKEVRAATGWSDFQVRTHLDKLVSLEYVLVHRGGRGQSFVYELVYDGQGQEGEPFVIGLIDPDRLQRTDTREYDGKNEHRNAEIEHGNGKSEGPLSIQRAPIEPASSIGGNGSKPLGDKAESDSCREKPENAHQGEDEAPESYVLRRRTDAGSGLVVRGSGNGASGNSHEPPTANHEPGTPNREPDDTTEQ